MGSTWPHAASNQKQPAVGMHERQGATRCLAAAVERRKVEFMLQSLLLTGIGGLLAIMGTFVGQHMQARVTQRIRDEDRAREDRYRLHAERLQAYVAFHTKFGEARRVLVRHSKSDNDSTAQVKAMEARNAAWHSFVTVRLIGSPDAVASARALMWEITAIAWEGKKFDPDEWSNLVVKFRTAARRDLVGADEALLPEVDGQSEWQRRNAASSPLANRLLSEYAEPGPEAGN